jgi:hypothetical protein
MRFQFHKFSEHVAIEVEEQSLSYAQLELEIERCSQQLKKLPQAILILNASPSLDFIIQLLAALRNHQAVALFSDQWNEEERPLISKVNYFIYLVQVLDSITPNVPWFCLLQVLPEKSKPCSFLKKIFRPIVKQ